MAGAVSFLAWTLLLLLVLDLCSACAVAPSPGTRDARWRAKILARHAHNLKAATMRTQRGRAAGHAGSTRAGAGAQVGLRVTRTVPPVDAVDRGRWRVGPLGSARFCQLPPLVATFF